MAEKSLGMILTWNVRPKACGFKPQVLGLYTLRSLTLSPPNHQINFTHRCKTKRGLICLLVIQWFPPALIDILLQVCELFQCLQFPSHGNQSFWAFSSFLGLVYTFAQASQETTKSRNITQHQDARDDIWRGSKCVTRLTSLGYIQSIRLQNLIRVCLAKLWC